MKKRIRIVWEIRLVGSPRRASLSAPPRGCVTAAELSCEDGGPFRGNERGAVGRVAAAAATKNS